MSGPCLCGDPYCPSCGAAQGTLPSSEDLPYPCSHGNDLILDDKAIDRWCRDCGGVRMRGTNVWVIPTCWGEGPPFDPMVK